MDKKIFFEWSNDTVIITAISGVVTIAVLIYIFKTISFKDSFAMWGGRLFTALIIIGVEFYFATITPLFLSYDEDEIRIRMVLGCKKIPYDDIVGIQTITPDVIGRSIRKVGSGGAGGYIGLFNNKTLGDYYIYATKKQDLVLVESKTRKYVFNCSERDELVAFVQAKL